MDSLLVSLTELLEHSDFRGTQKDLISSGSLSQLCKSSGRIVKIAPDELLPSDRKTYTEHLVALTRVYLSRNPKVGSWIQFKRQPDTRKVYRLLHEYGIRAEIFPELEDEDKEQKPIRSPSSLTLPEFYEVCQIQFHFEGSFPAFKRIVQREYGSFAEYCILKGYDINTTKWESDETAVRVAQKLGSLEAVKNRSNSLFKYLTDKNLIGVAFPQKNVG